MNEHRLKSALMQMRVGEHRTERWFEKNGVSESDLNEAVMLGYLVHYAEDPNDFMLDSEYSLTQCGQEFAWPRRN